MHSKINVNTIWLASEMDEQKEEDNIRTETEGEKEISIEASEEVITEEITEDDDRGVIIIIYLYPECRFLCM